MERVVVRGSELGLRRGRGQDVVAMRHAMARARKRLPARPAGGAAEARRALRDCNVLAIRLQAPLTASGPRSPPCGMRRGGAWP